MSENKEFDLQEFIKYKATEIEKLGFIEEEYIDSIKRKISLNYRREFIQEYYLDKIVMDGDKAFLKWKKRMISLTPEQLNEFFKTE